MIQVQWNYVALFIAISSMIAINSATPVWAQAPAVAASFDCSKAASPTEKLICSSAEISSLDGKLQQTYKTALTATDAYGKKALTEEQRNWVRYTRGICQDTTCLKQAYLARIAVLARNEKHIVNGEPYCTMPSGIDHTGGHKCGVYVVTYRDPNYRIGSFNQSLAEHEHGTQVIGCSRLIDLPVGYANGNHSFGGACVLQDGDQRKDIEVCNDDMIGHFQMRPITSQGVTDKNLIDFVYNNCSGS
ncbi:MAG: lysozyme inhibitor LprI family protein [Rhodanobacter sp.]